jgi:hypothetical protein
MDEYRFPDWFPKDLKIEMAIAGYRGRVAVQRLHQELTFKSIPVARKKFSEAQDRLSARIGEFGDFEAFIRAIPEGDAALRRAVWESGAAQYLYSDLGAVLLLVAASSIEELRRLTDLSIYGRGTPSYADGIPFARAVVALANQYKHRTEWIESGKSHSDDFEVVTKLVDKPLRMDAASEFLLRSGFERYEEFEAALLSCADGIVDPSRLPDGKGGIPTFRIRPASPQQAK